MTKPWSVVEDEELKLLRETAKAALELKRGCSCEYDYRCTACSQIIRTYELAEKALKR